MSSTSFLIRGLVLLSIQAFALASGLAQDKIYVKGSDPLIGTITKADLTSVVFQSSDGGSITIQRDKIERVEIPKPGALASDLKLLEGGKTSAVIQILEPLYSQYRGLPEPWIEEASIKLGEGYLSQSQWIKAKNLFAEFCKFYPNSHFQDTAIVGGAQAAFGLKQTAEAVKSLENLNARLEKEISLSAEQNQALGRGNVILGYCYLADQKNEEALEAFLKTTSLFYQDPEAVAEAQYQSALLFEKMNDISRAKSQLEELLKEFPNAPFAKDAKKKLTSNNQP